LFTHRRNLEEARAAIDRLEVMLDRLALAFGRGTVYDRASEALTSALRRIEMIRNVRWRWRGDDVKMAGILADAKSQLTEAIRSYEDEVVRTLNKEAMALRELHRVSKAPPQASV
jgi:hypothetical protein